jgi:hypothetical protein
VLWQPRFLPPFVGLYRSNSSRVPIRKPPAKPPWKQDASPIWESRFLPALLSRRLRRSVRPKACEPAVVVVALAALVSLPRWANGEAGQGLLKPVLHSPRRRRHGHVVSTSWRHTAGSRAVALVAAAVTDSGRSAGKTPSAPTNPVDRPTAIHGSADGPNPSSDRRGTGHWSTHNAPLGNTGRRAVDNGLGRCSAHGQSDRCHQ